APSSAGITALAPPLPSSARLDAVMSALPLPAPPPPVFARTDELNAAFDASFLPHDDPPAADDDVAVVPVSDDEPLGHASADLDDEPLDVGAAPNGGALADDGGPADDDLDALELVDPVDDDDALDATVEGADPLALEDLADLHGTSVGVEDRGPVEGAEAIELQDPIDLHPPGGADGLDDDVDPLDVDDPVALVAPVEGGDDDPLTEPVEALEEGEPVDLGALEDLTDAGDRVSATEYARFTSEVPPEVLEPDEALVSAHTDEVIPRVPAPLTWSDEHKTEWDRQSGEVTPLARIELVRRASSITPGVGLHAAELAALAQEAREQERMQDAVPQKGSHRHLPPKGDVVIGIDLGTTYTCAAVIEDGHARVIPSRRGTSTIPSVVLIHPGGKTIVGEPAQRKAPLFPANTIVAVKRLIGRPFISPVVQRARTRASYEIVEGDQGEAAVKIDEHHISLEEISALILKEVREGVSLSLHRKVNRAVITCPAYYNERQREAVRTAGELAGFHVERVLSEPTAAALSYGLGRPGRRRMLVYDLGGGTFDASLMEIDGNVFGVLATGGDTFLGGLDFDAVIVDLLVQQIRAQHRIDPREDPTAMAYLFQLAEQAKRDLSEQPIARVRSQHFFVQGEKPVSLELAIDRASVDALFAPLVRRTLEVTARVAGRAKVDPRLIDDVILVGGQSRSPIVRAMVREAFGREPRRDLHPDEVVAIGAARYAASMAAFDDIVLVDALPISIGIGLAGGRFRRIIAQDTPLPVKRGHRVETTSDGQTQLELVILQGEEDEAAQNELLGVLVIKGLPSAPRGVVKVHVTFELTSECLLALTAINEETGQLLESELVKTGTTAEMMARLRPLDDLSPGASLPHDSGAHGVVDGSGNGGLMSWLKRTLGPKRS
ncbi:Hsp70 family protein, partial [Myxococcota bacterium]|nr:Hsp70 family protein [Myxococcota bacterium]